MLRRLCFGVLPLAAVLASQTPARAERSLSAILVPAMLGATVAELEEKAGPVVEVNEGPDGRQHRLYDIRHCNFHVSVRDGRIEAFELGLMADLEGPCTMELGPFLGVTLPTADRMTLGDFIRAVGPPAEIGRRSFGMSCIDARDCAAFEERAAEFFWRGPQGLDVRLAIIVTTDGGGIVRDNPAAVVATGAWGAAMRGEGRDYIANTRFNCDDRHQRDGVRLFDAVPVSAVRIGRGLGEGQSYADRCH